MTAPTAPTNLVRASVLLVLGVGLAIAVAVGLIGVSGLEALGPSASLEVAVGRAAVSVPRFAAALVVVTLASLFVAAVVAMLSGRDFTSDLRYVEQGIDAMIHDEALAESIPLRTLDEVGALIHSFELLRLDFEEALERERGLRRDAEDADRAKAELLSAVSHELRTPLNAVLGFADVLLEEIDGPLTEPQAEDLRIIHSAGRHLMRLFNDVLDLSAAASDQLELDLGDVDLGVMLEELAAELRGQRKEGVALRVVAAEVPTVRADPTRVRQILTNLASNALKFTDEGEVRLELAREEDEVLVSVVDTGAGIAVEDLDRIFVEFGQAHRPRARRKGGAGLGLAIARRLAELHGGSIGVTSEPGVGSCFVLRLPRKGPS